MTDKQRIKKLEEALREMIVALRTQAHLAFNCGGAIALNEGNGRAWQKAQAILNQEPGPRIPRPTSK